MQEKMQVQNDNFIYPQLLTLEAQKEKLKCPNKIQAFSVCIDPRCQVAGLMCRDSNCQCIKNHYKCHHIQLDRVLNSINNHQKQVPQNVRKSYQTTFKIINEMLDQLSRIRRKLELEEKYFGLTKQELSFMIFIDDQKISKICGKIVSELEGNFDADISFTINSHEEILQDFQSKRQKFDSLCNHIENQYSKYNLKEKLKAFLIQSKIVDKANQKQLMHQWLSETSKKDFISSKLLFRASEHNFKVAEFHKYCDGIENTLVIVKTEFDKVIGGFTPNKWHSSQHQYVNDETGKAFLFSLTLREKYKCIDPKKSIDCRKSLGPRFGDGCDLALYDDANNNNSNYTNFPTSYNLQVDGINKYKNNQQAHTLFCGSTNNFHFKAKQYEVYQIEGI